MLNRIRVVIKEYMREYNDQIYNGTQIAGYLMVGFMLGYIYYFNFEAVLPINMCVYNDETGLSFQGDCDYIARKAADKNNPMLYQIKGQIEYDREVTDNDAEKLRIIWNRTELCLPCQECVCPTTTSTTPPTTTVCPPRKCELTDLIDKRKLYDIRSSDIQNPAYLDGFQKCKLMYLHELGLK